MTGVVVAYLIGVLFGLSWVLITVEALPSWRDASRRIDADIAFLQSIPKGMEDEQ